MSQSQSNNKLYNVSEAQLLYKRLFGRELDFYDMVELLPLVLRKTGSVAVKPFLFKGTIADFELNLPCGVHSIKHVSDSKPLLYYSGALLNDNINLLMNYRVDQSGNLGIYNESASNINVIETQVTAVYEVNKNVFTSPIGRMISFQNDNNCCLSFNFKALDVDVLYDGVVLDELGYPKVPDKTLEAIVYFNFFVDVRKRFHMKQADGNMLAAATQDSNRAIAQARTPESMSQNEMDSILNVLTSSNKKRHNLQHRS